MAAVGAQLGARLLWEKYFLLCGPAENFHIAAHAGLLEQRGGNGLVSEGLRAETTPVSTKLCAPLITEKTELNSNHTRKCT